MGGTYNLVQTVFTFSLLSKSANGIPYGSVDCRFQVSVCYLEDKPAGDIATGVK